MTAWIRFLGEIPKPTFEKSFFLGSTVFRTKSVKNKSCKSVENRYKHFNSKSLNVCVGKILHNIRLKIQWRRSAVPKAWELRIVMSNVICVVAICMVTTICMVDFLAKQKTTQMTMTWNINKITRKNTLLFKTCFLIRI